MLVIDLLEGEPQGGKETGRQRRVVHLATSNAPQRIKRLTRNHIRLVRFKKFPDRLSERIVSEPVGSACYAGQEKAHYRRPARA
jgi:hypothetical protein